MTEKKDQKLKLKRISTSGLIQDEATLRRKKARLAMLKLNKRKMQGGNVIDQYNAEAHADAVVQNRLRHEAEKAKEMGAMDEKSLIAYYDELREKFSRLTEQLTQKAKINKKELQAVKIQVKKESDQAIQDIASHQNLSGSEVSGYLKEIASNTAKLGDENAESTDSKSVIEGINKIEEVVQDAEIQSNFIEQSKKEIQTTLDRNIIPLILKGKTIEITVNDFFHLPLGSNEEDYLNFVQHFHYLDKLISEGKFSKEDYNEIKSISDKVPRVRYKKYFDLFKRGKFKLAALQAVHETWSTGKLYSLQI